MNNSNSHYSKYTLKKGTRIGWFELDESEVSGSDWCSSGGFKVHILKINNTPSLYSIEFKDEENNFLVKTDIPLSIIRKKKLQLLKSKIK